MYVYRLFVPAQNLQIYVQAPALQRAVQDLSNGEKINGFGLKLIKLWPVKVAQCKVTLRAVPQSQWSRLGLSMTTQAGW